jgi:hypothetical protein
MTQTAKNALKELQRLDREIKDAEAQAAAFEQVRALEESLSQVVGLAGEIAEGGDVYPAGVRDLCRRMGEDLTQRSLTLEAIAARTLDRA